MDLTTRQLKTILIVKTMMSQAQTRSPLPKIIKHRFHGNNLTQMRRTIQLIGQAILMGSRYLPIRNYAAALATLAPSKDYKQQAENIYNDIILNRWKYVKDPRTRELLTFGPSALATLVLALDGRGVGRGKGAGDCDCVAAAIGACFEGIGMKTRLAVTAPPNTPPGPLMAHVFVQVFIPKHGWLTADPVVHPEHGFGHVPVKSRIAYFSLSGQLLGQEGNATGLSGTDESEDLSMSQYGQIPDITQWQDYGMGGADDYDTTLEPEDWRLYGLPTWGAFTEKMGMIDGCGLGLAADVTPELYGNRVLARTPMLELSPRDYKYVQVLRRPYEGMRALGDTGALYEFDGSLGFFKKIWGGIKKVARKVRGGVRKVLKRTKAGRYVLKIGSKIKAVAQKFVRPLMRFVGKYAAKLAPVMAIVPGIGPAVAAGLYTGGKIAQLYNKYAVSLTGKKGKARGLKFKDPKKAKAFKKALEKAAKKEKKRQAAGGKIKKISKRGRRRGRRKDRSFSGDDLGFFPGFRRIVKRVRRRRAARRKPMVHRTVSARRVMRRRAPRGTRRTFTRKGW